MDILDMHRALYFSRKKAGVKEDDIRFRGFDGNNEGRQMGYTRYLLGNEGRWEELHQRGHDYNSHSPSLSRYRAMLREWEALGKNHELSKSEIDRILAAR